MPIHQFELLQPSLDTVVCSTHAQTHTPFTQSVFPHSCQIGLTTHLYHPGSLYSHLSIVCFPPFPFLPIPSVKLFPSPWSFYTHTPFCFLLPSSHPPPLWFALEKSLSSPFSCVPSQKKLGLFNLLYFPLKLEQLKY